MQKQSLDQNIVVLVLQTGDPVTKPEVDLWSEACLFNIVAMNSLYDKCLQVSSCGYNPSRQKQDTSLVFWQTPSLTSDELRAIPVPIIEVKTRVEEGSKIHSTLHFLISLIIYTLSYKALFLVLISLFFFCLLVKSRLWYQA